MSLCKKKKYKVKSTLDFGKIPVPAVVVSPLCNDNFPCLVPSLQDGAETPEEIIPQGDYFTNRTLPLLMNVIQQKAATCGLNCTNVLDSIVKKRAAVITKDVRVNSTNKPNNVATNS